MQLPDSHELTPPVNVHYLLVVEVRNRQWRQFNISRRIVLVAVHGITYGQTLPILIINTCVLSQKRPIQVIMFMHHQLDDDHSADLISKILMAKGEDTSTARQAVSICHDRYRDETRSCATDIIRHQGCCCLVPAARHSCMFHVNRKRVHIVFKHWTGIAQHVVWLTPVQRIQQSSKMCLPTCTRLIARLLCVASFTWTIHPHGYIYVSFKTSCLSRITRAWKWFCAVTTEYPVVNNIDRIRDHLVKFHGLRQRYRFRFLQFVCCQRHLVRRHNVQRDCGGDVLHERWGIFDVFFVQDSSIRESLHGRPDAVRYTLPVVCFMEVPCRYNQAKGAWICCSIGQLFIYFIFLTYYKQLVSAQGGGGWTIGRSVVK